MKSVTIYSDGACSGNPGPGGYGTILQCGQTVKELSQGFRRTTNNRMELRGVIAGLAALKEPCEVTVITDSQYVVNAVEQGWAKKWRANGWKRNKKDLALNPDLWTALLDLCEKHAVRFSWVRGHDGHPQNERCDELAVAAIGNPDLPEDKQEQV
jgi:ribonuclease HI